MASKVSYTVPCAAWFRDAVTALAEARGVNAADLARSILLALPATVLMFGLGWWIDTAITALIPKLLASGLACLASILLGFQMLGPEIPRALFRRIRTKFNQISRKSDFKI